MAEDEVKRVVSLLLARFTSRFSTRPLSHEYVLAAYKLLRAFLLQLNDLAIETGRWKTRITQFHCESIMCQIHTERNLILCGRVTSFQTLQTKLERQARSTTWLLDFLSSRALRSLSTIATLSKRHNNVEYRMSNVIIVVSCWIVCACAFCCYSSLCCALSLSAVQQIFDTCMSSSSRL